MKIMRKWKGFFFLVDGRVINITITKKTSNLEAHYAFKGLPTCIDTFSKRLEEHYNTQPPTTSLLRKPHKNILIGYIKLQKVWPFVDRL